MYGVRTALFLVSQTNVRRHILRHTAAAPFDWNVK